MIKVVRVGFFRAQLGARYTGVELQAVEMTRRRRHDHSKVNIDGPSREGVLAYRYFFRVGRLFLSRLGGGDGLELRRRVAAGHLLAVGAAAGAAIVAGARWRRRHGRRFGLGQVDGGRRC